MALSDRDFPPGPRSGRLLLRMPSSLHERVAVVAMAEDVSLNMYICTVLAGAVEWQAPEWPPGQPRKVRNEIRRELWFERHGADRRHDDTGSW